LADPYSKIIIPKINHSIIPVRIKGRAKSSGKGISNALISDGVSIVKTDSN